MTGHNCTICGKAMYQSRNLSDWWLCRPCKTSVGYYSDCETEYKRQGENIKSVPYGCLLILKDMPLPGYNGKDGVRL